jgi:3-dehydroquinate synthase
VGVGLLAEVGAHALAAAPAVRRWAVVSDDRVGPLYGETVCDALARAGCAADLHVFPAGEAHKTRDTWAALTDALLGSGLGRDGGVIAIGGGVTGDLAGFVAATYMRGIPVIQVPTSVVAMVDSSVGGKTGVDTRRGKNLVGAFHPPAAVLVDPATVATLPRTERAQGWAEAVKHGAILDEAYLERLVDTAPALLDGETDAVARAVVRSIELKAEVVGGDERERGRREILNFGHTLGHALETASGYALPHGSAIAVGMILESGLGERLGVTRAGTTERLRIALESFELPTRAPAGLDPERVAGALRTDKKVRGGHVRLVLLERVGRVARDDGWARVAPADQLHGLLADALAPSASQLHK